MSEFRVLLEGGNVLVVTIEVEEAEEQELDPATLGASLLNALGIGRRATPVAGGRSRPRSKAIRRPVEENADDWLKRTSKESLRGM